MTVNASKERIGADGLDALFAGATEVVVAKGKRSDVFAPASKGFDRAALHAAVLGPTGNLRAPAVRRGKRWLVGFHAEAWGERLA